METTFFIIDNFNFLDKNDFYNKLKNSKLILYT